MISVHHQFGLNIWHTSRNRSPLPTGFVKGVIRRLMGQSRMNVWCFGCQFSGLALIKYMWYLKLLLVCSVGICDPNVSSPLGIFPNMFRWKRSKMIKFVREFKTVPGVTVLCGKKWFFLVWICAKGDMLLIQARRNNTKTVFARYC